MKAVNITWAHLLQRCCSSLSFICYQGVSPRMEILFVKQQMPHLFVRTRIVVSTMLDNPYSILELISLSLNSVAKKSSWELVFRYKKIVFICISMGEVQVKSGLRLEERESRSLSYVMPESGWTIEHIFTEHSLLVCCCLYLIAVIS